MPQQQKSQTPNPLPPRDRGALSARHAPGGIFLQNENGLALLMAIFFIAFATIIITNIGATVRHDQLRSRKFAEGAQAEYVLKSIVNLAKLLVEMPKLDGIQEDWLGEPWAIIASAPELPISGFSGSPQLMIVDEDGKIDLNSILTSSTRAGGQSSPPGGITGNPNDPAANNGGQDDPSIFWKNAMQELFTQKGFV